MRWLTRLVVLIGLVLACILQAQTAATASPLSDQATNGYDARASIYDDPATVAHASSRCVSSRPAPDGPETATATTRFSIESVVVAANAGARMADGLIGVPQAPMSRALARLQGLRLGDKSIVQGVDAFGSRAGSTFRGRGPAAGSDLDLLVRIDPTALGGPSGPWIQRTLRSIADDFEAEAGFPLSIHAPGNTGMFEKSIPGATFVPLG